VIEETLSILDGTPQDVSQNPSLEECPIAVSPRILALGVTVLRHIPVAEDAQRLLSGAFTIKDGWLHLMAQHALRTLYKEWGGYLGRGRSAMKLEEMARKICVNTAQPIVDKPDASEWLAQFCGPNLRWEMIGLLCCLWVGELQPLT
jgi:hypothetical protein